MKIGRSNALYLRIVSLIFSVVLLVAVLTNVIYTLITPKLFAEMKAQELIPKAKYLSENYISYSTSPLIAMNENAIKEWIEIESNSIQAYIILIDRFGQISFWSHDETVKNSIFADPDEIKSILDEQINMLLSGESIMFQGSLRKDMISTLVVGEPMRSPVTNQVIGATIIVKPLREIVASLSGLNQALLVSLSLGFILIVLPILLALKSLLKPLGNMRVVAMSMAQGDFSAFATEVGADEIGQLGMTLNYLSRKLSKTISELVVERNRLEQVLNGLTEGIIACDEVGNITHLNPAIGEMFRTKIQGESENAEIVPMEIVPYEIVWNGFKKAISDKTGVIEHIMVDDAIISMNIVPLEDTESNIVGAVGLFRDITEAERLEQTRRDYVANVSHELRTPLTALRGLVEPLKDNMVKDEAKKQHYYEIMHRETLRLSRLVDDLLQLSRLQSGTLVIEWNTFNVEELLLEVKDKYSKTMENSGIDFGMSIEEKCPPVRGNEDRIEQVLTILLDNACKFTPSGGRVDVEVNCKDDKVVIAIKDTGCGIPKDSIEHVFERFYKVDKARSSGGTGLGLSIAKEILEQMGEDITVESAIGIGSKFVFTLPIVLNS